MTWLVRLTCHGSKADTSQLNLPHGTSNYKVVENRKKAKK